jgi:hypothetical protein
MAPSGVVALIGTPPALWEERASPVERDLCPGRSLHPETWCYLLADYGFTCAEAIVPAELGAYLVSATRGMD